MKNKLNPTQKLVLSAIIMALYIAILFISQAISFGAVQMRLATALYGLTYIFPFWLSHSVSQMLLLTLLVAWD